MGTQHLRTRRLRRAVAQERARHRRVAVALLAMMLLVVGGFVLRRVVADRPKPGLFDGPWWILIALLDGEGPAARGAFFGVLGLMPDETRARMVLFPTLTQVTMPGYGVGRLKDVPAVGGLTLLRQSVEGTLGHPVNRVVALTPATARKVFGSTEGLVPATWGAASGSALPLDAATLARVGRVRADEVGERPALVRQMQLLGLLMRGAAARSASWGEAWSALKPAGDLTGPERLALCRRLGAVSGIRAAVVPGTPGFDGVWIPDINRMEVLFERLGRPQRAKGSRPMQVEVLHGPGQRDRAMKLAETLGAEGLMVVRLATGEPDIATRVVSRDVTLESDAVLERLLPGTPWLVTDDPSPFSADYSVLLGGEP
ncbi:MAG: hypothetical protein FJY99_09550 [Candidatus Sericytochromatia bacterium]|nr:hypothetical protein [Candidatus Tanganyikabacteria bacterium]